MTEASTRDERVKRMSGWADHLDGAREGGKVIAMVREAGSAAVAARAPIIANGVASNPRRVSKLGVSDPRID